MLNNTRKLQDFLQKQSKECMEFLFANSIDFSVVVRKDFVDFSPPLPKEISDKFGDDIILFALTGYTFQSADVSRDELKFEAGFGAENYASVVSIKIKAIIQILVKNEAVFLNVFATSLKKEEKQGNDDEKSISKSALLSNPRNKKFFK